MANNADLTLQALADLAVVALSQQDLHQAHGEICRIAVRAIGAAQGASVTVLRHGQPGVSGTSDPWAESLDELQYVEAEGPCFESARSGNSYRVRDLSTETRWPSYVPRATALGARSTVSLPMNADGQRIGALNMYSRDPDAFSSTDVAIGQIIAAHAGLAADVANAFFAQRELAENLRTAMQSRADIEQAKGIIMAQNHCGPDEAFAILRRASQGRNLKLRDLATDIVRRAAGSVDPPTS